MTEPPFDIDRIRDDLHKRKARQAPRVLTPGRKRRRRTFRQWLDSPMSTRMFLGTVSFTWVMGIVQGILLGLLW